MEDKKNLYVSDFITGLLAALTLEEVSVLSLRKHRLDIAIEKLNDDLEKEATLENLKIRFHIQTHPIHRDSSIIQEALYEAAQRDLVSLDNPEFQDVRLKISIEEAPLYLNSVLGSPEMYKRLAKRFIQYYRDIPIQQLSHYISLRH